MGRFIPRLYTAAVEGQFEITNSLSMINLKTLEKQLRLT